VKFDEDRETRWCAIEKRDPALTCING